MTIVPTKNCWVRDHFFFRKKNKWKSPESSEPVFIPYKKVFSMKRFGIADNLLFKGLYAFPVLSSLIRCASGWINRDLQKWHRGSSFPADLTPRPSQPGHQLPLWGNIVEKVVNTKLPMKSSHRGLCVIYTGFESTKPACWDVSPSLWCPSPGIKQDSNDYWTQWGRGSSFFLGSSFFSMSRHN